MELAQGVQKVLDKKSWLKNVKATYMGLESEKPFQLGKQYAVFKFNLPPGSSPKKLDDIYRGLEDAGYKLKPMSRAELYSTKTIKIWVGVRELW